MQLRPDDARWLAAAASLAERARPLSRPNPGVGAIIVRDGKVAGRGWTQAGGRPHAEAMALEQAGEAARGATLYVTLEPCAHSSERGPACADLAIAAGLAHIVVGMLDPDPRTAGKGLSRLMDADTHGAVYEWKPETLGLEAHASAEKHNRPNITLKLALSLDGCIATAAGQSQWITGLEARAHTHRERARCDAILVGGETMRTDNPRLDVRLPGLEDRSPARWVLTRGDAPVGWQRLASPADVTAMPDVRYLLVEGGAQTAAAFLQADLVDRLLIYRAPILIGGGKPGIGDIGLASLTDAHQRWERTDFRPLGNDMLEAYSRTR